jgi:hypothetical protein
MSGLTYDNIFIYFSNAQGWIIPTDIRELRDSKLDLQSNYIVKILFFLQSTKFFNTFLVDLPNYLGNSYIGTPNNIWKDV